MYVYVRLPFFTGEYVVDKKKKLYSKKMINNQAEPWAEQAQFFVFLFDWAKRTSFFFPPVCPSRMA